MFTSFSTKNPSKSHSQPATFKRQRRVSVACTNCRSRKIRCIQSYEDSEVGSKAREKPCQRCTKRKLACEYLPIGPESESYPEDASPSGHTTEPSVTYWTDASMSNTGVGGFLLPDFSSTPIKAPPPPRRQTNEPYTIPSSRKPAGPDQYHVSPDAYPSHPYPHIQHSQSQPYHATQSQTHYQPHRSQYYAQNDGAYIPRQPWTPVGNVSHTMRRPGDSQYFDPSSGNTNQWQLMMASQHYEDVTQAQWQSQGRPS